MTVGSCSSPARIFAGSPGSSCCRPKISIDTSTSVGTTVPRRRARKPSIEANEARARLRAVRRHLQPRHPQQPVGQAAHAAQLGVVGPEPVAVVEIDDRPLLQHPRGDLLEHLLALRRIAGRARLRQQRVGLRVAVAGVVERLLAAVEAEQVAVGVGPAAPGEDVGLEVALVGHVERGRELGRLDLDVEAGVARHRLDHHREALRVRGGRRHQGEARPGDARLLEQRLGALDVALGQRQVLRVPGVARRDPLVADLRLVVHHHLRQALPVDGELERLAHPRRPCRAGSAAPSRSCRC